MDDVVSPRALRVEKPEKLERRQDLFVIEYMKDRNGTQAAIRAGYSSKGASVRAANLLAKSSIRRLIDEKERALAIEAEIDEAWVMKHLKQNVYRAIDLADVSALNRTLELIGKQIGMFVDRSNINIALEHIDRVERRIVHPQVIDDVDYSVDDKRRKD
jgi:phage terminase small subunit